MKAVHEARNGQPLSPLVQYLTRKCERVSRIGTSTNQGRIFGAFHWSKWFVADYSAHLSAFEHISRKQIFKAADRLEKLVKDGNSRQEAWNNNGVELNRVGKIVYLLKFLLWYWFWWRGRRKLVTFATKMLINSYIFYYFCNSYRPPVYTLAISSLYVSTKPCHRLQTRPVEQSFKICSICISTTNYSIWLGIFCRLGLWYFIYSSWSSSRWLWLIMTKNW